MFGNRKAGVGPIESLIGSGTVVEGNIRFKGGLRIDGEVLGSVSVADGGAGALVVSELGRIRGPVHANHLVSLTQNQVAQVGRDKPSRTGNKKPHECSSEIIV